MEGRWKNDTSKTRGDVTYTAHKGVLNEYCMYGLEINCRCGFISLSELSSGIIFKAGMGEVKLGLGGTAVT